MKKKFIAVALVLAMSVTAMAGCGKKSDKKSSDSDTTDYTSMTAEELQDTVLKDVEDYVTIGYYSNIEVEVSPVAVVTDGAVETELQSWLDFYPLQFEGACVSGDSVNIDYVGKIDGNEFDGGTYEGYDLELGSGSFITGFEEQVEGMNVGDTKDINVTFPDDYSNSDVAGKPAVFTVTLNYIKKAEGSGTLTDQWVAAVVEKEDISDKVTDLTVDAFKEFVKGTLEDNAQDDYDSSVAQAILDKLNGLTNYDNVPDDVKNKYIANEKEYQESYITNQYGMELSDYFDAVSIDEDTFNADVEKSDYLLLNRPVGYLITELDEKKKWVFDGYPEFLPGEHIASFEDICRLLWCRFCRSF